ncbi:MAG: PilZ domain-containing protein [Acidobacteriia bacterium]|nr:PilZ domain-containing protein [Terriglobia bacterium]
MSEQSGVTALQEKRSTERLMLSIPIRVLGFESTAGEFAEDTRTSIVNRTGARIALKHRIAVNDTLRVINLESYSEADFRVVAPTAWSGQDIHEWGVECLEPGRNIWGIEFGAPLTGQGGALIQCQGCRKEIFLALTPMEAEVLESTGVLQRQCSDCNRLTNWMHSDIARQPKELPPTAASAPPSKPIVAGKPADQRQNKRIGMKFSILVRGPFGQEEVSKTENISKGGLALSLAMELNVGEVVRVLYPYSPGGQNIEQKAEIRRRAIYAFGGRRLYGLRLIA